MASRGLGWKKDPPKKPGETPDRLAAPKLRALPDPPETGSCRKYILSIYDQGQLGSCTANSTSQNIRAGNAREGVVNPAVPSRLFLYYLARAYDGDTATDAGAFIRNNFQAAVKFGFPAEEIWPYSDDTTSQNPLFSTLPSSNAFRLAFDQNKPTQYLRIDSTGQDRINDVKRAISAGYCVSFGTMVSEQFCSQQPGTDPIAPPVNLPIAGGHALLGAEYDAAGIGIVNSWSDSWGQGGWCKFSWDYITWDQTDDLWIVEVAPKLPDPSPAETDLSINTTKA
jgi:Papain family cysteine protease